MQNAGTGSQLSDELGDRLVKSLDFIGERVESASSFTYQQAPVVVKEMLLFKTIQNSAGVLVGIALAVVCGKAMLAARSRMRDEESLPEASLWLFILAFFAFITSCACLVGSGMDLVSCIFTPKYYIVNRVADEYIKIRGLR